MYSVIQHTFDCSRATFFLLNKRIEDEFFSEYLPSKPGNKELGLDKKRKSVGSDKYRQYLHFVDYDDTQEMEDRKLLGIARGPTELCLSLIFPSIITIEKEVIRTHDKIAICIRHH